MTLTEETFNKMIKTRTRKHTSEAFQYFWASFVLQLMVYAMFAHVIIRYWGDLAMILSVAGLAVYLPFTFVFMNKYKGMATASGPINTVVSQRIALLQSFYTFKKRYELVLIPVATFIGTFIVFELWVPGSVWAFPQGALITFFMSLAGSLYAIRTENKKSFDIPLSKLRMILNDLNA